MQTLHLLLALYLCWMCYIGYRAMKGKNMTEERENFLIAGRSASAWVIALSIIMGWIDTFYFSFTAGLGYSNGWGGMWYTFGAVASFLFLIYFAGRIREEAAQHKMYMFADYFSSKYSPRCGVTVGIVTFFYFFLWMLIQFVIGAHLIADVSGFSYGTAVAVLGLGTLLYLLLGGFLGSLLTDVAQFLLFAGVALIIVTLWIPQAATWNQPVSTLFTTPFNTSFMLFMLAACATIAAPDVWQRIYSAKSEPVAKRSMLYAAILLLVTYTIANIIGMVVKAYNWADSPEGIPAAFLSHMVPSWLTSIGIVMFFAITMSTIATTLFGSAMSIGNDVLHTLRITKPHQLPFVQRVLMTVLVLLAIGMAFSKLDLMTLAFSCLAVTQVVMPMLLMGLFRKKVSEPVAFYSMLGSLAVFVYGLYANLFIDLMALAPLGVATLLLALFCTAERVTLKLKKAPVQN